MAEDRPFTVKAFYDFLREKRLMGNLCADCKTLMVPPRLNCIHCKGKKLEWTQSGGKGSLETFTVIHVPPTFLKKEAPYTVGIIKLAEGPMIVARLMGVDVGRPEKIELGMDMIADYIEENGRTILAFKPA